LKWNHLRTRIPPIPRFAKERNERGRPPVSSSSPCIYSIVDTTDDSLAIDNVTVERNLEEVQEELNGGPIRYGPRNWSLLATHHGEAGPSTVDSPGKESCKSMYIALIVFLDPYQLHYELERSLEEFEDEQRHDLEMATQLYIQGEYA
jgi:hypothetical protein